MQKEFAHSIRTPQHQSLSSIKRALLIAAVVFPTLLAAQVRIAPNDSRIAYDGVWYAEVNADSALLMRHSPACMSDDNCAPSWAAKIGIPQQHPGVVIRFKTSSPTITLLMSENEVTPYNQRRWPFQQYGLYRDGEWIGVFHGERSSGRAQILDADNGISHTYEVVLPHQLALVFRGLELSKGKSLEAIEPLKKPVYVSIGNSITHGEGQTGAFQGFAWKIARAMGWELINLSIGGSTISPEMVSLNFKEKRVDVVSVEWGYNDWASEYFTLAKQTPLYTKMLSNIRSAQPNARIYLITPFATTTARGLPAGEGSLEDYRQMMRDAAAKMVKGGDNKIFVIEGEGVSTTKDLTTDGIHLSPEGAARVAKKILAQIRKGSFIK